MAKKLFLIVGVASVILLGVVVLYHPAPEVESRSAAELTPREQLDLFIADKMNYGVKLSRLLAGRRIERAQRLADEFPELRVRAEEVIDSLRARLDRKAVVK